MSKIYIPSDFLNNECKEVHEGFIRVFDNDSNRYHDIFINQDYQVKEGITTDKNCDNYNIYTDDIIYRTDFDKILIIFVLLAIIFFSPGLTLFKRMFRRFR